MAVRRNPQKTSQSRVFIIPDRAAPNHTPRYETLARTGAVSWDQGSIDPIRVPDPQQYGKFITIDKIRGQAALPQLSLDFRSTRDLSDILALVRKGCPIDIQIHIGACKDPSDFDAGWEKIQILEDADFSNYSTDDLGAFDADQEAVVTETVEVMGSDYYEVKPLAFEETGGSQIVQNVLSVVICDSKTCGACGLPSDGCQRVFALQTGVGASPGLPPEIVYTDDGGATWDESNITSHPVNTAPAAIGCVGPYLVAVSNADDSIHYALISDLFAGDETWTEVTTGIVAAGSPNQLYSTGRVNTWIVADGGYIYFSSDITAGVEVQQAGDLTVNNLTAIHGIDDENIIVGGASNTILVTSSGGAAWSLVTGPSAQAGVAVTTVYMASSLEWQVGYDDGDLYYTYDGGVSWVQKSLPGGLTAVDQIKYSTRSVGYLSARVGTSARLLRTISGGNSWYVLPESAGLVVPTAAQFNSIAACAEDPNLLWAGGLRVAAGDGILVRGS